MNEYIFILYNMYTGNLDFIEKSLSRGDPIYGIISLATDTLDAMRTGMVEQSITEEQRRDFDKGMSKMLAGLREINLLLSKLE